MKLIAKYLRHAFTQSGDIELTFSVGKSFNRAINQLNQERLLDVSINDKKSQRSLNQNAYLWALIHEIDLFENGRVSKESEMELYKKLISLAHVKIEYWQGLEAMKPSLENFYRVIEVAERRSSDKADTVMLACFRGSSHFSKEEMIDFIDATLDYATKLGMDITYYEKELKDENNSR